MSVENQRKKQKIPSKAKPKKGSGVKRNKNNTLLMEGNKEAYQTALTSFAKTLSPLKQLCERSGNSELQSKIADVYRSVCTYV